jgi:hypothetical protein
MRRTPTLIHLVIVDEDRSTFAVEGPMIDDTAWNDAVCDAQQNGRKVRCFSTKADRAEAVRYQESLGLVLVESSSIVRRTIS